jgi:hypothetical protein
LTSVEVAALGSSRSASTAPPSASTAVTASTGRGRRVTPPTRRRRTRSITPVSLGEGARRRASSGRCPLRSDVVQRSGSTRG